jgi:pyridoxamine 5'-phosphate oxidase
VPEERDENAGLLDGALPDEPLRMLQAWIEQARAYTRNPDAMSLATLDPDGWPSARMVVLRGFDVEQGFLVFYTDRDSRKGRALAAHARASLVFYWDALSRQVRIEGPVTVSPDAESDSYFASRPLEARLGAWASRQSQPVASRADLEAQLRESTARFGVDPKSAQSAGIPRPTSWGGYRVWAARVELWAGRWGRLHDRVLFERGLEPLGDGFRGGPWTAGRLQP